MKRTHVLTAAAMSWPLTLIYWLIPGAYDFPYFFTLLCLAVIYFMPAEKEEMSEAEFVDVMRDNAVTLCMVNEVVNTDNLRELANDCGMTAPSSSVWSRILTRPMFKKVGEVKSKIPSNDGRKIGVYRLAGEV